jgi:hypothetical protein
MRSSSQRGVNGKAEKLMRTLTSNFLALSLAAATWSQPNLKPGVDWGSIEQQLEQFRAAVQARDIDASYKVSQQLWTLTTNEWVKQSPTAADRLAQAESQHLPANATSLPYLAMLAVQAQQFDKAQWYALQTLQTPSAAYDSIHTGNIVLGLVALSRDSDVAAAKQYLLLAETKGSPILDRWGPNLALAKALIDRGEREAVLEYFQSCQTFVTKNPKLNDWIAMLKGGGTPDLSHEYLWHQ